MADSLFILKKVVGELSGPLSVGLFIAFIGLAALFAGRLKTAKLFLPFAFVWIALFSYGPVSDLLLKPLEQSFPALIETPEAAYILVLGNGHSSDEKLPITSQISATALARLSEGVRHYNRLEGARVVVSGYRGVHDPNTHASIQKKAAMALGVDAGDIIMFEEPRDTQEEAMAMKKLVGSAPFILVTSASHMARAMAIFRSQGLSPIAAPADYHLQGESAWLHMPRGESLRSSDLAFHEYLGLARERIRQ